MPHLRNQIDLCSHIWREELQTLNVPWQHSVKWLRISSSVSFFFINKIFEKKKRKKSWKTPHLENQKDLSSHSLTPDLQSPSVSWQHPTAGLIFWTLVSCFYIKIFFIKWKNYKTRHISKSETIWAVILGHQINNPENELTATHYRFKISQFG